MSLNRLKAVQDKQHGVVLPLLLALALVFFLGHESQHDLPSLIDVDTTQCEFCLNGTGPLGIAVSHSIDFSQFHEFYVRTFLGVTVPQSFLGFSYTSRAPPVA